MANPIGQFFGEALGGASPQEKADQAGYQSQISNYASQMSNYMNMLMGPIDPNDPVWGPYIKSITSTAQSMAGGAATAAGISGPLATQGIQSAGAGALANMQMQRMGLGLQAGQQSLGGISTGLQGVYNQEAQSAGVAMNGMNLLTGLAGVGMKGYNPAPPRAPSSGGGY